ncbi:MAG: S-layer homology domain-containing protein [bacterium]
MCLFKVRNFRLAGVALVFAAFAFAWAVSAFAAEYEDSEFDRLARFQNEFASPFEDVTPDHWAYKAVKHLADVGLLEGYEGKEFLGNRVVTRYELAILISRLLDNYVELQDRGSLRVKRQVVAPMKSAMITPGAAAPKKLPAGEMEYRRIEPKQKLIVPIREPVEEGASAPGELMRRGPAAMEAQPTAQPMPAEGPAPVEVRFEEVEKKISLTQKDVEALEKLVESFRKELKDISKDFKKELREGKKISLKNEREIAKLKDDNQRFNVTGENDFLIADFGATHGREKSPSDLSDDISDPNDISYSASRDIMRELLLVDVLKLNIKSKPNPTEDLTLGAQLISENHLTGDQNRLYYFKIEDMGMGLSGPSNRNLLIGRKHRDKADIYLNEVYVNYSNTREDPKNPKNFKLRSMNLGEISLNYSPLTFFMMNFPGAKFEFKLNKYVFNMFGARVARHPTSKFLSDYYLSGWPRREETTRFFDRYIMGASVGFPLFGETKSMTNVTKIFMYDDEDTAYPGCQQNYGQWVDIIPDIDVRTTKGASTDVLNKDIFCLPPEKNSVTSFFTRYPLMKNVWFTGEYAHSTYLKPRYFARKIGAEECDRLGTITGSINCFDIPEQDYHDDAFLLLLDYSKPPIKMFPLGYAKLGTEFVTKYLGLPGFDMSSLGVSFLPINIQGLGIFITNFGVDRLVDKNYAYETYYIQGQELEPGGLYFDVGELLGSMSTSDQKEPISEILPKPISFINNRQTKARLKVWMNNFKYNLSDKISMKAAYTDASLNIPTSCLDSNLVFVRDEDGNKIDVLYGDGATSCKSEGGLDAVEKFGVEFKMFEQKYTLNWKTSKTTDFEGTFKISDMDIFFGYNMSAESGAPPSPVEELVTKLAPSGRSYMLHGQVLHKLTSSTELKLGYLTNFDVYPDSDDSGDYPVIDSDLYYLNVNTKF